MRWQEYEFATNQFFIENIDGKQIGYFSLVSKNGIILADKIENDIGFHSEKNDRIDIFNDLNDQISQKLFEMGYKFIPNELMLLL